MMIKIIIMITMKNRTPATRSSDFVNHSYDYRPNWTSTQSCYHYLLLLLLLYIIVIIIIITPDITVTLACILVSILILDLVNNVLCYSHHDLFLQILYWIWPIRYESLHLPKVLLVFLL